jgi:hypothetical protein
MSSSSSKASATAEAQAQNQIALEAALDPQLLELFKKLLTFPVAAQTMLAQLMVQFSQRIRDMQALQLSLRSAGADRLLIYLKVQALWPEVANSAILGKAFKSSLLLDAMGQTALCFKTSETVHLVALYLDLCKKKQSPPIAEQMESLVMASLMQGGSDCRQVAKFLFKP